MGKVLSFSRKKASLQKNGKEVKRWNKLHRAAERGDYSMLTCLLGRGDKVDMLGPSDMTPLQIAACMGKEECVEFLVEQGADVNHRDKGGNTPLHWVVSAGSARIVKKMLEEGADPCIANVAGNTPLKHAQLLGEKECERILREAVE